MTDMFGPGFDSLQLHQSQYQIMRKACKHYVCGLFSFIENDLFNKEGKLPNNFHNTINESLKPFALKVFKDKYLLDFIAGDKMDDERHIEQQVVLNIRNFYTANGQRLLLYWQPIPV